MGGQKQVDAKLARLRTDDRQCRVPVGRAKNRRGVIRGSTPRPGGERAAARCGHQNRTFARGAWASRRRPGRGRFVQRCAALNAIGDGCHGGVFASIDTLHTYTAGLGAARASDLHPRPGRPPRPGHARAPGHPMRLLALPGTLAPSTLQGWRSADSPGLCSGWLLL